MPQRQPLLPPGPKSNIPGKLLLDYQRNAVQFLVNASKYGDVVYWRFGKYELYLLNHPDYVKDILITNNQKFIKHLGLRVMSRLFGNGLLTSEGDFHHRERRLVQPAFHHERIESYADIMTNFAERTSSRWIDRQIIDIHKEMLRLTLAVVTKALFNVDIESEASNIGQAFTAAMEYYHQLESPFYPILTRLPLPSNRRFKFALEHLDSIIYGIISERRRTRENTGDLLSMLLQAYDTGGDGGSLNDQQLRDECVTLLFAGHETVANALTWTWYLLSQNPEAESKLHDELKAKLHGKTPGAEDVKNLPYTTNVLTESMRLYPPAYAIGREATQDYLIPGTSYVASKGATVAVSQYVIHRDPRYFSNPEKFDPDRWKPEMKSSLPKFAYFPFGAGPRSCVGEPFAWMEGVLLLATIAQKWRMKHVASHKIAPMPRITLRPKYGMQMLLEKRG